MRKYPVPGLLKAGKNTIAVRVMDHGAPSIAGKPEQLALKLGRERLFPCQPVELCSGGEPEGAQQAGHSHRTQAGLERRGHRLAGEELDANDPGMTGKWYASEFDDSKWKIMKLPKHYETAGLPGHDGTGGFRRAISVRVRARRQAHWSFNSEPSTTWT